MLDSLSKILLMIPLGERVKRLREKTGLTQDQVASAIGEERTNYNNFENCKRGLTDEKLKRLAQIPEFTALDVTYARLKAWKSMQKQTDEELKAILNEAVDLLSDEELVPVVEKANKRILGNQPFLKKQSG